MGSSRRRLTREDLEALRKEFDLGEPYSGEYSYSVDAHLAQIRRMRALGVSLEAWAKTRGLPLAYARALGRYLDQD